MISFPLGAAPPISLNYAEKGFEICTGRVTDSDTNKKTSSKKFGEVFCFISLLNPALFPSFF
jgi:hypothetical protein